MSHIVMFSGGVSSWGAAKRVADALAEGWEPLGGVAVSSHYASCTNERKGWEESETRYTFLQAMVRS